MLRFGIRELSFGRLGPMFCVALITVSLSMAPTPARAQTRCGQFVNGVFQLCPREKPEKPPYVPPPSDPQPSGTPFTYDSVAERVAHDSLVANQRRNDSITRVEQRRRSDSVTRHNELAAREKSCYVGAQGEACELLGEMYGELGWRVSWTLYQRACDLGVARGCSHLGRFFERGIGVLARDSARARSLYQKGCDGGDYSGCNNLGWMYDNGSRDSRGAARAIPLYRKACDGGVALACTSLGSKYENGAGVPRDIARAVALYRKACDAGDQTGCGLLGRISASGSP